MDFCAAAAEGKQMTFADRPKMGKVMKKTCLSINIMKKYIKLIKRFTLLHL